MDMSGKHPCIRVLTPAAAFITYCTLLQACEDCTKECPGTIIRSLEALRKLEGCTTIVGDLSIQISGSKYLVAKKEVAAAKITDF